MNTFALEDIYTDTMDSLAAEIMATETMTLESLHKEINRAEDSFELFEIITKYETTICDDAAIWGTWAVEEVFEKFLTHKYANVNVRVAVYSMIFTAEFDAANIASQLLWNGDRDFATRLVLAVSEMDEPSELFQRFGLSETPLACALKQIADIRIMPGRVAGEFVYKVLFDGMNALDAYNAARESAY